MSDDSQRRPHDPGDRDLTTLLHAWQGGDGAAFAATIERLYRELRRIAMQRLGAGGPSTLSPTELVHEAVLGLISTSAEFANRAHFLATMSLAMRSILVDHARARSAEKRGGDQVRVTFGRYEAGSDADLAIDMLALDQALSQLEAIDARCGRIMHLTYFAGLEQTEIAELLGVSVPTVKRDLRFARAWLLRAIEGPANTHRADCGR